MPVIVPFYAAILGFIFVFLSSAGDRGAQAVPGYVGAGGHQILERRIRAHGNFSEYVPITMILLTLHGALWQRAVADPRPCIALILGRCLHAYCVGRADEDIRHRRAAMVMTFARC